MIPQIILIVLVVFGLAVGMYRHGSPICDRL